jgi:hypothetical protein
MAVNLIVLAITLMMFAFLIAWVLFPRIRPQIEAPKYRVLTWQNRFPEAERSAAADSKQREQAESAPPHPPQ